MELLMKRKLGRESRDYLAITFGLICYSIGWAAFMLPYQITTGGVTGISAIIYYVTGIEIQVSYFIINAIFMGFALKILGPKFSVKTVYAIFMLTFLLWLFQTVLKDENGNLPQLLGPGQDFMACVIGAGLLGFGIDAGTDDDVLRYCHHFFLLFHFPRLAARIVRLLCTLYHEYRDRLCHQQYPTVGTVPDFLETSQ